MATIEEKLQFSDGRPSGFDYLRMLLALMVVIPKHPRIITFSPSGSSPRRAFCCPRKRKGLSIRRLLAHQKNPILEQ